jgi:hypothetical protein
MPRTTLRVNGRTLPKATKSTSAMSRRGSRALSGRKRAADPIFEAIGVYFFEHERFNRACSTADDVAAKQEGRVITDADKAEWSEAERADTQALMKLVKTRPTTVKGVRALLDYAAQCSHRQAWDKAAMEQLLESILKSAPLRLERQATA